ncbi:MAG: response regulator [Candidatus Hydrogenedentes bacterium]|nr:response regulator [Candidatus Hydrogenedentota bacterium]
MAERATEAGNILVVDDLPENTQILKRFLAPMGYTVFAVSNGTDALNFVEKTPPDVILLDLMMPGMNGFEVCRRLKGQIHTRHIPIIIITGLSDKEANVKAVTAGADDFLIKPFDRILLEARIKTSVQTKMLQDQILEYQHDLEIKVQERTRQVRQTQAVAVFSLAKLAESRDNETGDHLERMRSYARLLAEEMSTWPQFADVINPLFVERLYESTPLHDIGKVGIPDRILLKPGKLTDEEFEVMKRHTLIGGDTLRAADQEAGENSFLSMGCAIAYYHHEKWNGTGYPFGIAGTEIPLAARIAALADVYDALSSKRPYKEPFSHEKSRSIILEGDGEHFDPDVVKAFMAIENKFLDIRAHFQDTGKLSPLQEAVNVLEHVPVSH